MKKLFLSLTLLLFVGTFAPSVFASNSDTNTEISQDDDKKRKRKRRRKNLVLRKQKLNLVEVQTVLLQQSHVAVRKNLNFSQNNINNAHL